MRSDRCRSRTLRNPLCSTKALEKDPKASCRISLWRLPTPLRSAEGIVPRFFHLPWFGTLSCSSSCKCLFFPIGFSFFSFFWIHRVFFTIFSRKKQGAAENRNNPIPGDPPNIDKRIFKMPVMASFSFRYPSDSFLFSLTKARCPSPEEFRKSHRFQSTQRPKPQSFPLPKNPIPLWKQGKPLAEWMFCRSL